MSMSAGNKGVKADINITPYIDILLVLLIIFMTTAPMKPKEHLIRVPQRAENPKQLPPDPKELIIVEMDFNHSVKLNDQPITLDELKTELTKMFSRSLVRNMFVRGDGDLNYGDIFILLDIAKDSGAQDIALLERKVVKATPGASLRGSPKSSH
jgi:biopolymer transport protein TolR